MDEPVAIFPVSDSFEEHLPRLVGAAGAEHVVVRSVEHLMQLQRPEAVIVCAAGRELEALGQLETIPRKVAPIAVVATENDHLLARRFRSAGASEYFLFPAQVGDLRTWLEEIVASHARAERAVQKQQARHAAFGRLLGKSATLREALDAAAMMSGTGASTILITGETGTGKDVLAQAIHARSTRAAGPFVEVNCAALPANLLEAELFGHEKGAFTDARAAKPGLIEAAEGGTLFLDEIGDLPMDLQGKLLRVLETKRVRRLGSVRDLQVDFRLLAATHVDLPQRIRERRFREDLFYRLDVLSVTLPPLRKRHGDSVLLAEHFAAEFGTIYGLPVRPLSPDVRETIESYAWPGNVRQLRNAVERAVILGQGEITVDHLRIRLAPTTSSAGVLPFPATLQDIQVAAAHAALTACAGNKSRAADLLGISRKGLYALLRSNPAVKEAP